MDDASDSERSRAKTVARGWASLAAVSIALLLAVFAANRPIAPRPRSAPREAFSEERAMPIVRALADDIGVRPTGSPAAERAAQYLAARLREIPRMDVEIQRVEDTRFYENTPYPYPLLRYHVVNVVARLPGRTRDAILLDAHFDTLGDSAGAGDDALGVAAIIEAARALASGPMLERSVIVLCNGGEEYGLFGADGFIRRHRLAADVRAYVYLDGSPGGAATLLYSGPGNPELVEVFARSAPRPQATSLVLDLMESNILAHDGDFRPLRDAGKPGLSFGAIGDLWAAHTSRDRSDRVQPGTLQHYGESTLAITRALASGGPLPRGTDSRRVTYFDVLGLVLVRYSPTTGAALAFVALALSALALAAHGRAGSLTIRGAALAAVGSASSLLVGALSALAVGVLLAFVLRRPHGWYSAPALIVLAFAAPSAAAILAVQSRVGRALERRGHDPLVAVWSAAVIGWSVLLALATARGSRSGYLPLAWTVGLALGLLALRRWPRARVGLSIAACVPGALLLAQFAPVLRTMCAEMAFLPLPIPADPVLATLVGVMTCATGALFALGAHSIGGASRAALALALVALVGVAITAVKPPFTVERPRRVFVVHGESDGRSGVLLRGLDALPLEPALGGLPEARPIRPGWSAFEVFNPPPTHEIAAGPPAFAPPTVEVLSSGPLVDGTRAVRVRLRTETTQLRLFVARGRLASWSLHPRTAENEVAGGRPTAYFQGVGPEGEELTLVLRGAEPVELEVIATSFEPDAQMNAIARRLPPWAVMSPMVARTIRPRI
jgi:hypothetical protein